MKSETIAASAALIIIVVGGTFLAHFARKGAVRPTCSAWPSVSSIAPAAPSASNQAPEPTRRKPIGGNAYRPDTRPDTRPVTKDMPMSIVCDRTCDRTCEDEMYDRAISQRTVACTKDQLGIIAICTDLGSGEIVVARRARKPGEVYVPLLL